MRFLRLSAALVASALLVACGLSSDIGDYASGAAGSKTSVGASGAATTGGSAGQGTAGKPSGGAAGATAGAGQAGQGAGGAGQSGAGGGGQAGAAGAGGAAAAGTGGATSGGASGAGGGGAAGQSAGAAGQAGGTAGSGGAATGLIGLQCAPNDSFTCLGAASAVVLKCAAGVWQNAISCAEGKLCDGSLASNVGDRCAPIVPECEGQSPGASVCQGAVKVTCGPDLVTSTKTTCGSATLCELGAGSSCAECAPGSFSCTGTQLSRCTASLKLEPVMTCMSAAQCNAASGACTSNVCVPGTFVCTGAKLEKCDPTGAAYVMAADCSGKLCDAANGQCDVCVASTKSCKDATAAAKCSSDGQISELAPCADTTPWCVGAGSCVACRTATDCPVSPSQCLTRACIAGACGVEPKPAGTSAKNLIGDCKAGFCDGQGGFAVDLEDVPPEDANVCTVSACKPGPTQVPGNDGMSCAPNSICKQGKCVCVPKSTTAACVDVDGSTLVCGSADDGCGAKLPCGTCPFDRMCCNGGLSCADASNMCIAI